MTDKTTNPGRTPVTPTSSVRAIVSLFENENSGSNDKEKGAGRGRHGGFQGRSLAGRAPMSFVPPATPTAPSVPATPSPRCPANNISQAVPVTTQPPSTKAVEKVRKEEKPETAEETYITTIPQQPPLPVERKPLPSSASSVQPPNTAPTKISFTDEPRLKTHQPPSTPTTPIWRGQRRGEVPHGQNRPVALSTSTSLPVMPSVKSATPPTPVPTPYDEMYAPTYTPEAYSLELLQYQAYFGLAVKRNSDSGSQLDTAMGDEQKTRSDRSSGRGQDDKSDTVATTSEVNDYLSRFKQEEAKEVVEKKAREEKYPVNYRDPRVVEAFWTPVRQYLFITDEELYDP